MRVLLLVVTSVLISACSSVHERKNTAHGFDSLFFAQVMQRQIVVLKPNESKSARVWIGLASAGVVGAIAAVNTEAEFSRPKAYEYILNKENNKDQRIISRSIVDVGTCVEVISPDASEIEILRKVSSQHCTVHTSNSIQNINN